MATYMQHKINPTRRTPIPREGGPKLREKVLVCAGWRWKVEESFQAGKELAGLDEHQVRRWTSWHRWVTLAMLAHAFLVVATVAQRRADATATTLIALTVNEFRRLFDALLLRPLQAVADVLASSTWRRKHQARARACHHRKHRQQQ